MSSASARPLDDLMAVVERHWGYRQLRPLQAQAMRATLDRRDSLVVMPTGGGKSLCYQAPAVLVGGTTVVVSPLIALMKDQVDGLRSCGVSAAQLDSSLSSSTRASVEAEVRRGRINLLFVSPERLVQSDFHRLLAEVPLRSIAIDEAHCISHWGHDFRPEYRMLSRLREFFPDVSVHGYTATATEQVRRDIASQLNLQDPVLLVGNFDRHNLTYRVWPRHDALRQTLDVIERHPSEAGIVYCMRRKDVDDLAAKLQERGVNALPYHAGLTNEQRQQTQEAFASERCDVVVATIAFGMGIDRSNVRFVIHTAMPKSLEHYQQETGRAGRDGLEAECVLLYSGGDMMSMRAIIQKSAAEAHDQSFLPSVLAHLADMDRYARGAVCRHKALVGYFGQDYTEPSCKACDLCLGDTQEVPDAVTVAKKILSCVARVKMGFGLNHVLGILRGKNVDNIRRRGHDKLSTFGLLSEASDNDVRDWIYQLIGQEVLVQTEDEFPKLALNDASWEVMRGERPVRLVSLVRRKKGDRPQKSQAAVVSWEGVDEGLFELLRGHRRDLASQRQVSAFIIFSDATLREMARVRPTTPQAMRLLSGVSETKLRDLGPGFLELIEQYCRETGIPADVQSPPPVPGTMPTLFTKAPASGSSSSSKSRVQEFYALFRQGLSIEEAARQVGLTPRTMSDHLANYIAHERPKSIDTWVDETTYHSVLAAIRQTNSDRLKPIFLALGEQVNYDTIRLVVAHVQSGRVE